MSSAFRDFPNAGILSLPFVMTLVRSASDIFCTSAPRKSRTPSFFPIDEPLPSAPWQAAHFDLYSVDASCACTDSGRLRTTANAVAIINTLTSILFMMFNLRSNFPWSKLGPCTSLQNAIFELPEADVSVTPVTYACDCKPFAFTVCAGLWDSILIQQG